MTKEDKQLLLADLCGRLLYGVMIDYTIWNEHYGARLTGISEDGLVTLDVPSDFPAFDVLKDELKPYLRPMSSMTEEESDEFQKIKGYKADKNGCLYLSGADIDWLNKKHFDYRGLIPKGLAIKALEGMYKF